MPRRPLTPEEQRAQEHAQQMFWTQQRGLLMEGLQAIEQVANHSDVSNPHIARLLQNSIVGLEDATYQALEDFASDIDAIHTAKATSRVAAEEEDVIAAEYSVVEQATDTPVVDTTPLLLTNGINSEEVLDERE